MSTKAIVILILIGWSFIGMFVMAGVTDALKYKKVSWKQWTFLSILCGPVVWFIGILYSLAKAVEKVWKMLA